MAIIWKQVHDELGIRYWIFYDRGCFNKPRMIIDHYYMKKLAQEVQHEVMFQEVPAALKQHRENHGFTQVELAEHLGISRNYVSMIERGVANNMTLKIYENIINYLMEYD